MKILQLQNLDEAFAQHGEPIVLNKIDLATRDYADILNQQLFSNRQDLLSVPSCDCGHFSGTIYSGLVCPKCRTHVNVQSNDIMSNSAWISAPRMISALFHPKAYMLLADWLKFGKADLNHLDVLLSVNGESPIKDFPFEGRGFNYVYEHFDEIIAYFMQYRQTSGKAKTAALRKFLELNRANIFCRYIPIMSKSLYPIIAADNASDGRKYVDASAQYVQNAAIELSAIEFSIRRPSMERIEKSMFTAYKQMIAYYRDIEERRLSRKSSHPRQHVFGSRLHWTFRSVIIPITTYHRYDELHLPWGITVNLLKIHVLNRLIHQYGYTMPDAANRQAAAILKYDPLIHKIVDELIATSDGGKGLPVLFNRPPTLRKGSVQKLHVTKMKVDRYPDGSPDISDHTISMSVLCIKDCNGDFDGDALAGLLPVEIELADAFQALHPSRRYLSTNSTGVSTNITLPKQTVLTANSFLGEL